MIINEELLAKFDRIQDLPISEEIIGAYMEGGVSESESIQLSPIINSSPEVSSMISDIEHYSFELEGIPLLPPQELDIYDINVDLPSLNNAEIISKQSGSISEFGNVNTLSDTIISSPFDSNAPSVDLTATKSCSFSPASDSSMENEYSLESSIDSDSELCDIGNNGF